MKLMMKAAYAVRVGHRRIYRDILEMEKNTFVRPTLLSIQISLKDK